MGGKLTTVLITCCQGKYLNGTIRSIRENEDWQDYRIIGVDMSEDTKNYNDVDEVCRVPASKDRDYLNSVLNLCLAEKVDLIIPTFTGELDIFRRHKAMFDVFGIKIAVTQGEGLVVANDKCKSIKFMKENGIKVPKFLVSCNADEIINEMAENEDTEYVLKIADSCGGRGLIKLGSYKNMNVSKKEIQEHIDKHKTVLLEEYLEGDEYTVDLLICNGSIKGYCVKKNLEMFEGVAYKSEIVEFNEALDDCIKFATLLKLEGNVGFDIKCNSQGVPYIIDSNPRLTANVSLATAGGCNLVYQGIRHALGLRVKKQPVPELGTYVHRTERDHFYNKDGVEIWKKKL